ncbi:MAG TPA: DUF255 domain-containing protein, partial [Opitutaceae bacterium]|nr:DUF255 domain-containing protein [Opitutaceae bacterium]
MKCSLPFRAVACALLGLASQQLPAADASLPFSGAAYASPVQWMPLGEAAFARARRENKPVYVLVGTFLSELSRSTADSFANAETAAYFNAHFVCVLVDRDERPDFAAAAQDYIRTVKQFSGWPVSLWLTPAGQPYDGANYLPTIEEWGKRSMRQNAAAALAAWQRDPAACRRLASEALAAMTAAPPEAKAGAAQVASALDAGLQGWRGQYDGAHPGFGDPPRYPQPELLRWLIRRGGEDRRMALASLRALAAGALRDPLDGGFFRYLQDAEGRLPYPQKTLGDQARLAQAYLDAYRADADPLFAACARGALDYVQRLARGDGFYAGAEDATGSGGLYYAWSAAEISAALGADAAAFDAAYGVQAAG